MVPEHRVHAHCGRRAGQTQPALPLQRPLHPVKYVLLNAHGHAKIVGEEIRWELELQIRPQSASPAVLEGEQQLGWSGWLGESPTHVPVTGMRFEPEGYAAQLKRMLKPD